MHAPKPTAWVLVMSESWLAAAEGFIRQSCQLESELTSWQQRLDHAWGCADRTQALLADSFHQLERRGYRGLDDYQKVCEGLAQYERDRDQRHQQWSQQQGDLRDCGRRWGDEVDGQLNKLGATLGALDSQLAAALEALDRANEQQVARTDAALGGCQQAWGGLQDTLGEVGTLAQRWSSLASEALGEERASVQQLHQALEASQLQLSRDWEQLQERLTQTWQRFEQTMDQLRDEHLHAGLSREELRHTEQLEVEIRKPGSDRFQRWVERALLETAESATRGDDAQAPPRQFFERQLKVHFQGYRLWKTLRHVYTLFENTGSSVLDGWQEWLGTPQPPPAARALALVGGGGGLTASPMTAPPPPSNLGGSAEAYPPASAAAPQAPPESESEAERLAHYRKLKGGQNTSKENLELLRREMVEKARKLAEERKRP